MIARLRLSARVLVGPILLSAACTGDAGPQPYVPKPVVRSEVDVVGCYEIASLVWDVPASGLQHLAYEPPPAFFLSPDFNPLGRRRIVSAGDEFPYQYMGWRLAEATTIEATWREATTILAIWRATAGTVQIAVKRDGRDPAIWAGAATRLADHTSFDGRIRLRQVSDRPCSKMVGSTMLATGQAGELRQTSAHLGENSPARRGAVVDSPEKGGAVSSDAVCGHRPFGIGRWPLPCPLPLALCPCPWQLS